MPDSTATESIKWPTFGPVAGQSGRKAKGTESTASPMKSFSKLMAEELTESGQVKIRREWAEKVNGCKRNDGF
jgi:hypothetical protein